MTANRARVRNLFLRIVGGIVVVAFWSLWVQADVLFSSRGLLPVCAVVGRTGFWGTPSLLHLGCSDFALRALLVAGMASGVALALLILPGFALLAALLLYTSVVTVGGDFLSFQWDNLLLETLAFSLFVAPWRSNATPPHPLAVVLIQSLLVRLNVESGLAKWLFGDPTWRDLTAMVSYYETAPLPTWIGWWAHQMPVWAHQATGAATYVVEGLVPWLIWGPRRWRVAAMLAMIAFQVVVIATANYGFFNYLSIALCLWFLDDDHLPFGRRAADDDVPPRTSRLATAAWAIVLTAMLPLSVVPFAGFVPAARPLLARVAPVRRVLNTVRWVNAYHLFASMTFVRREPILEGSRDGVTWKAYEFRYKPGDPLRPPPFVAPHQPRVDFQLWFLLLGDRGIPLYLRQLIHQLLGDPAAVRSLFAVDPFPDVAPVYVRIASYRYRFTDRATRDATGAWWTRELDGMSKAFALE